MRRLQIGQLTYQVRPSFVMPYQIGWTHEVEKGLFMYHSGASFDAVSYNHGHDPMYWYRAFRNLGRLSIVGTTVKKPENIPKNLLGDEKHTRWCGEKVYLATTVGDGCILGAALSSKASEIALTQAYEEFESEAWNMNPTYEPESVNLDGWQATQNAWDSIFGGMAQIVGCFFHAAKKIQDRCRRWPEKKTLMTKVWDCYRAESLASFSQRLRRLEEWAIETLEMPQGARDKVLELCARADEFKVAYAHKTAHRTSNMLDRLMDYQDRFLYRMRYLHSKALSETGRLFVRAIGLMWNFHPFTQRTGRHSPFADLNGFVYHDNWLENLLIAGSLGGQRS